jgi:hypothetical protein
MSAWRWFFIHGLVPFGLGPATVAGCGSSSWAARVIEADGADTWGTVRASRVRPEGVGRNEETAHVFA